MANTASADLDALCVEKTGPQLPGVDVTTSYHEEVEMKSRRGGGGGRDCTNSQNGTSGWRRVGMGKKVKKDGVGIPKPLLNPLPILFRWCEPSILFMNLYK